MTLPLLKQAGASGRTGRRRYTDEERAALFWSRAKIIGAKFGISIAQVSRIRHGLRWSWLDAPMEAS
jgi:hypothetical protein